MDIAGWVAATAYASRCWSIVERNQSIAADIDQPGACHRYFKRSRPSNAECAGVQDPPYSRKIPTDRAGPAVLESTPRFDIDQRIVDHFQAANTG